MKFFNIMRAMVETSVIIPTYNRLPFLKEAVTSVLNQIYRNFELIVVDDGSTDGSQQYYAKAGKKIRYLYQDNAGPSSARNRGIREAQGQFITFLDSDDLWRANKLGIQIDFMQNHSDAVVCYTDEIWIRNGVRVNPKKKHGKYSGWIFEHCLPLCIVSPSSVLMRREFFDKVGLFDETLPACEDYDLWLRAALKYPFHYIREKLIIKRGGHPDQLSAAWGLDRYRIQSLLRLLENEDLNSRQRELIIKTVIAKCQILMQGFRKHGKPEEADFYRGIIKEVEK